MAQNEKVTDRILKIEVNNMNTQRAQEIVESMKDIEVLFNGSPVWIQHVDQENGTARVYEENNPEKEMTVPVEQLNEQ